MVHSYNKESHDVKHFDDQIFFQQIEKVLISFKYWFKILLQLNDFVT